MKPTAKKSEISLASILEANKAPMPSCSIAEFLQTRKPHEVAAVFEAMADLDIEAAAIHKVLAAAGWTYNAQVIRRHRHKACRRCQALGLKDKK